MKGKPENIVIIIGSMKSGTTYLYSLLSQHPAVCECITKEPHFFADRNTDKSFDLSDIDSYYDLWPDFDSHKHTWALEASTNYTKRPNFPNAAERISLVKNINFKFIYCVREPVSRIQSHLIYMTLMRKNTDQLKICDHYINVSRYYFQIKPYLENFSKKDIYIVPFGRLHRNQSDVMKEICDFLDINSSFEFTADSGNRNSQKFIINKAIKSLIRDRSLSIKHLMFIRVILQLKTIYAVKKFVRVFGKFQFLEELINKLDLASLSKKDMEKIDNAISGDLNLFLDTFDIDKSDLI